ncbi:MAG: Npt1/Npt2 family nucleotide transporter [Gallionellaceae bacterium]|nr:Npt1/Npt2 family nucleotide transporter [Gallionellaceae bacterium]
MSENLAKSSLPPGLLPGPLVRSLIFSLDFFLIITALYHLKPAARSLLIEALGADSLPYVWIGSAVALLITVAFYRKLLQRFGRVRVVLASCLFFVATLVAFRVLAATHAAWVAVAFYIYVDIFGVVLAEQFWSLADGTYRSEEGRHWYGLLGTGGLVGGVAGGLLAAFLIRYTPLQTPDLMLVAATFVGLVYALTVAMQRQGLLRRTGDSGADVAMHAGGWRLIAGSRYLLLIAAALLLAQAISPLVEYQFLHIVEAAYPEREARTAALSLFFSVMGGVSIAVNLMLTPLILNYLGVLAGLLVQPLALAGATGGFMLHPTLIPAAIMKISDRGLAYSINRAAKELLYIPVEPMAMYQAKAWIDMFGYRLFKAMGSLIIIVVSQWTLSGSSVVDLGWVALAGCLVWTWVLVTLNREYQGLIARAAA